MGNVGLLVAKLNMKKFLTAKWQNLVMANYVVAPELLQNRLPKVTSLDFHEGNCFVSLVGFMFVDTRVFGNADSLSHQF